MARQRARRIAPVAQLDRVPDFESDNQNPQVTNHQALTENPKDDLACFLALLKAKDPDLAQLVSAWPRLSPEIRQAILRISSSPNFEKVKGESYVPTETKSRTKKETV